MTCTGILWNIYINVFKEEYNNVISTEILKGIADVIPVLKQN